ncbi:unnamed protein product [Effrenium voratum]|uniref:Uncharacterized protein n=1 Tax=Effrenium voratum TaxID=2562239 RepID=A0AA36IB33_9DINO|nr:unnamed protein product [Effrenium voratum]
MRGADLEEDLLPLLEDADVNVRLSLQSAPTARAGVPCAQLALHKGPTARARWREVERLAAKLSDPEPFVRRAAAASLGERVRGVGGRWGAEGTWQPNKPLWAPCNVAKALLDRNTSVALAAAHCLVSLGAPGAAGLMRRLLREEDDENLGHETAVLERIMLDALQAADAKFIEPYADVLVVFLAAGQPEVRSAAWSCLSKVTDKGFQYLVKKAHDPHIVVRKGVAEAIAFLLSGKDEDPSSMDKQAAETLAGQLTDPSDAVRLQACEAFKRIGGSLAEAHVADLARCLQEHDVRVYRTVIEVLADLGPASAPYASLLRARLEVPEASVRASSAKALGRIGTAGLSAAPFLALRLEEDTNLEVKRCAVEALGLLGGLNVAASSQVAKAHANCLASQLIMNPEASLRRACAVALGQLGQSACGSLHELVLALGDSDLEVRRAAAHALTGLGEGAAPEVVAIIRSVEDTVDIS